MEVFSAEMQAMMRNGLGQLGDQRRTASTPSAPSPGVPAIRTIPKTAPALHASDSEIHMAVDGLTDAFVSSTTARTPRFPSSSASPVSDSLSSSNPPQSATLEVSNEDDGLFVPQTKSQQSRTPKRPVNNHAKDQAPSTTTPKAKRARASDVAKKASKRAKTSDTRSVDNVEYASQSENAPSKASHAKTPTKATLTPRQYEKTRATSPTNLDQLRTTTPTPGPSKKSMSKAAKKASSTVLMLRPSVPVDIGRVLAQSSMLFSDASVRDTTKSAIEGGSESNSQFFG